MTDRSLGQFYFRWSLRELISGHFWAIVLAVILIVASVFSLFALSERMSQAIDKQGKDALLADVVFESANPPPQLLLDGNTGKQIQKSLMTRFSTMLFSDSAMKLVTVKAIQSNYPLRGELLLSNPSGMYTHIKPGTVWLDKGLMQELNLHTGDSVAIGDFETTISGKIAEEPGISFNPFRQLPSVYIHQQDLVKTGAIQTGSRVKYNVFINASRNDIENIKSKVKLNSGDKWRDTDEDSRASHIFEKTRQYVSMIVVIIVLMASTTLVITSQSYVTSRTPVISALRCMGATKSWIIRWLVIQLGLLLSLAIIIGLILGGGFEFLLRIPLKSLLPEVISPLTVEPYIIATVSCMIVIFPSVGIPIRRLWNSHSENSNYINSIISLGLMAIPLLGLAFIFRGNAVVWLMLASIIILFAVLASVSLAIIYVANRFVTVPSIKLALMRMNHTKSVTGLQLGALSLSLMLITVIWMVKGDLFSDWRSVLPADGPNIFAFNISTTEKETYLQETSKFASDVSPMYPILRGRIAKVNDENAVDHAGGVDSSDALRREINFTWADTLPTYNDVIDGKWTQRNGVSVEAEVAADLNVKIGDKLTFVSNSIPFSATVNSIRNVEWRSMKPNFYFIFTPDVMAKFSASWLVSYRLLPEHNSELNHLSRMFPTVSVIDLRTLTQKIQDLLGKVIWAISLLSGIAVLAGFLLIITVLMLSIESRKKEVQIYRTLGSSKTRIRQTLLYEFGLMGFIASLVAYVGAEVLVSRVSHSILNIDSSIHWIMLLVIPTITVSILLALVHQSSRMLIKEFDQQIN